MILQTEQKIDGYYNDVLVYFFAKMNDDFNSFTDEDKLNAILRISFEISSNLEATDINEKFLNQSGNDIIGVINTNANGNPVKMVISEKIKPCYEKLTEEQRKRFVEYPAYRFSRVYDD